MSGKVAAWKFLGNNLSISSAVWAAGRYLDAWIGMQYFERADWQAVTPYY
jgi:hypothetical protein